MTENSRNERHRQERTEPAGLLRRLAALAYDLLLLSALLFVYTLALVVLRGGEPIAPGTWWFELSLVGLWVLFFAGFWTHGGQTLGMRAWRLRLVGADAGPVGWGRALLRAAAGLVSAVPAGLGFWWALLDPERRCWHDRWSGTRLIREAGPPAPGPEPRPPAPSPSTDHPGR